MAGLDSLHLVSPNLYCGGPFLGLRDWVGAWHSAVDLSRSWPQLRDRVVIGTYRGRTAIALACRLLGIGPAHEVLVPAYNCGTEIDAVLQSGAQVVGYRISRRGIIDLEDLIARRTNRTRAVYLIHYFGWEQPMGELRRWCDTQGLLLIEDCALALFSSGPSGGLGRTGDAAVFSLPKTLGFRHGGLLSLAACHAVEVPKPLSAGFGTLCQELRSSAQAMTFRRFEGLGLYNGLLSIRRRFRHKLGPPEAECALPPMPSEYYFKAGVDKDRSLHPRSYAVAGSAPREQIVRRRRENYLRMAGAMDGIQGVTPLFDELPEAVCPLSLPLLMPNRDECAKALQAMGIAAFPWWAGFHRNAIDWAQFPDSCWLKRNLLTLPVHQGLDDQHLEYMLHSFAEVWRNFGQRCDRLT